MGLANFVYLPLASADRKGQNRIMASPNPADYFLTPSLANFYVDESSIVVEGKPHLLSCGVICEDSHATIQQIVELKASLGAQALDEVKFNSSGLPQVKKIILSDGVIEIVRGCTIFICINEGADKGKLAESVAQQAFDYCVEKNVPHFSLNYDVGFVPDKKALGNFVRTLGGNEKPVCVGVQHLDSAGDQLIQLADLFLGLFRLSALVEFGEKQISRTIYLQQFDEEEEWSLSEVVFIGTRGHIWGKTKRVLFDIHPDEGEIYHPYHASYGLGIRVDSTVSPEALSLIQEKLATTYLGCMS